MTREEQIAKAAALAWVLTHGSERLKKCAALGMFDTCRGLYLEERLGVEAPGFYWSPSAPASALLVESPIRNPTLAALRALERAREHFYRASVNTSLVKIRHRKGGGEWREAIRAEAFAWAPERIAYSEVF